MRGWERDGRGGTAKLKLEVVGHDPAPTWAPDPEHPVPGHLSAPSKDGGEHPVVFCDVTRVGMPGAGWGRSGMLGEVPPRGART